MCKLQQQHFVGLTQCHGCDDKNLTAYDIQSAQCHIREDIESITIQLLFQFVHQNRALLIENVHKVFQNLKVECWSQNL